MIPKPRVYVSCPLDQHLMQEHREVKAKILTALSDAGFEPHEFVVSGLPVAEDINWSFKSANQLMQRCQGALILAFTRHDFRIERFEMGQMREDRIRMPSEYAHFEGALATSNELPTFIVADESVRNAGITYMGGGKFINYVPFAGASVWLESEGFKSKLSSWIKEVKSHSNVFFGYCNKAKSTADAILKFLRNDLEIPVIDWSTDFRSGNTVLNEIQDAIRTSRCGIFLFTRDDPLAEDPKYASPRDNVIFEAGYCTHAKGVQRTLIILEEGAKMPADLGGSIYIPLAKREDISTIETRLRKALEMNL
jgi:hypothetical protein